jgi:hypothetical protein
MDLTESRSSYWEQERTADLLRLMPVNGQNALDIGARDGHFSLLMADRFEKVTALDLTEPDISHPKIECLEGNAAQMPFSDGSFDFVFCAEVLEHIPSPILQQACQEIERVCHKDILIGVPYKQDIRVGRTTCRSCGKPNPPWGHVNSFDEQSISKLFPSCEVQAISLIGVNQARTNGLSAALMDFAGNPHGTYDQIESCIHCGQRLVAPPPRNAMQRIATKSAFWLRNITEWLAKPQGNWLHMALRKKNSI